MNAPIRRVSTVAMALFLALMVNISLSYLIRSDSLNANPANRRVTDAQFAQDRGPIMVGNTPIATTVPVTDAFQFQRSYPQGSLYAAITGFYSYTYGSSALESSYAAQLNGTGGGNLFQRIINSVTGGKTTGAAVETTIDARAQKAAAQALGSRRGAVVALDYKTGAVLALVSTPSYDPNVLASHNLNSVKTAWEKLLADPTKPMLNRATRELYQPGSTFKVVVSAAALEAGYTPDTMVDSPLSLKLPGTNVTIDEDCGGTQITLTHALEMSCNPAYGALGMKLGAAVLRAQANKFGFGTRPLSDIGSVASVFPASLDTAQTAMISIGEFEVKATPLQMAMVAAAVANSGILMDPYIVKDVRAADLSIINATSPQQLSVTMSANSAWMLQDMMVAVVENGTGTAAQINGVRVGGKTGTAETDYLRNPYAWFICFADDPAIAVAVFVENAEQSAGATAGGAVAAPVARAVIQAMR